MCAVSANNKIDNLLMESMCSNNFTSLLQTNMAPERTLKKLLVSSECCMRLCEIRWPLTIAIRAGDSPVCIRRPQCPTGHLERWIFEVVTQSIKPQPPLRRSGGSALALSSLAPLFMSCWHLMATGFWHHLISSLHVLLAGQTPVSLHQYKSYIEQLMLHWTTELHNNQLNKSKKI